MDGPSRLSLLNNAYYRDVLGEYGAFFAIANRIDRIHKNAWIGFQFWRATAHMVPLFFSLSITWLTLILSQIFFNSRLTEELWLIIYFLIYRSNIVRVIKQVSLSKTAEKSLLDAVEARKHGDTLYFWARLDKDPRNPLKQDFWSFCNAINAGNCQ